MSSADINDDDEQKLQHAKREISSSRKECTSCEQNNNVDDITEGINSIAVLDDVTTCANCGKEGKDSDMNTCNKCKMVKYCNAACKKKHRSRHKKACQRRVAELHDEQLFKEHTLEDCPICFLPILPSRTEPQSTFQPCCGKIVCNGCTLAIKLGEGKDICAFCRLPPPKDFDEEIKKLKNLMDKGNGEAFNMLGGFL